MIVTATNRWPTTRLKYIASINDEALPEDTAPDFELRYIDIGNVDSSGIIHDIVSYSFQHAPSRARRRVRHGDVIISTVRTYLQAITPIENPPDNLIVSTGFAVVHPRNKVLDTGFCKYALREHAFLSEIEKRSVGVSYPAINSSELGDIPVSIPPLPQQLTIADYLDRETAKIAALVAAKERLLDILNEKRQAIITHAVTRGINPNASLRDSGIPWLGKIPEHWETKRLRHISPYITVGVVVNPSSYVTDEGVPFLYGSDITEEGIKTEGTRRLSAEVSRGALAKTCLHSGDVVTVRVGAPGITAVVPPELDGANCASIMLTRGARTFDSYWLSHAMNSVVGRSQVDIVRYGAAQEQFNISHAVDFWFAVPPLDEQRAIVAHIASETMKLDDLRAAAERTIALSKERRAALIAAAVTGKIKTPSLFAEGFEIGV